MGKTKALISNKERSALFRRFSAISTNLCKKNIRVKNVEAPNEKELGYTSEDRTIHLSTTHEIVASLPKKEEQIKFVKGVWVHEQAHQLFTNFRAATTLYRENAVENSVYHTIFNIVEDARIENLVPGVIGGIYTEDLFDEKGKIVQMSDLTYSKRVIYRMTPAIDKPNENGDLPTPFEQVINAMIQYGDAGIIKGKFTDPEAEKIFAEILPIYDSIIEETNPRTAIAKSITISELTRPLWNETAEFMNKIMEEMKKLGKGELSSSNTPLSDGKSAAGASGSSSASKNREKTRKKIKAEEVNKMAENGEISEGGSSGGSGGEIVEIEDPENLSEKAKEALKKGSPKTDEGEEGAGIKGTENENESGDSDGSEKSGSGSKPGESGNSCSKSGDNSEKTTGGSESENSENSTGDNTSSSHKIENVGHKTTSGCRPEDYSNPESDDDEGLDDYDDYVVPDSEIEQISNEIKRFVSEDETEIRRNEDLSEPVDVEVECYKGKASVVNLNVSLENVDYDNYERVVGELRPAINNLTSQFQRLFKNRATEKVHKSSGKLNVTRAYSGKISSRIFDKRHEPSSPNDIAIFLLIDESGSMSCMRRYEYAKLAAIGISEMCEKTGIPLYVMGFTADEHHNGKNYSAVHYHYIKWKNNKLTRQKLLYVSARDNNFDGFSVRYATKILSKRREHNKFLITISDGAPAAYYYRGLDSGIQDTRQAVKEANRVCTAMGVAIGGDASEDAVRQIYGDRCLCVPNVQELFQQLAAKVKKLVKEVD